MPNPFFFGGKIINPDHFIGRTAELRRLFASLETDHTGQVQHTSVVGERRIGKSSLLYHLTQTYAQRLTHPERYRFLYIDLDDPHCQTQTGLHHHILETLNLPHPERPTLTQFQEALERFCNQGHYVVLCLDEFEHLSRRNSEFPDAVYEAWRSLGQNGHIAFITASHTPLVELARQGNLTSPFHNIFTLLELGPFTPNEAATLLERAAIAGRPFTPMECRCLCDLTHCRPGQLQFAAQAIYALPAGAQIDWSAIRHRLDSQFAPLIAPPPTIPWRKRLWQWLRKGLLFLLHFPRHLGRFILDLAGRTEAKDSSAWILGLLILALLIAIAWRFISPDTLLAAFKNTWRFFSPEKS